MMTDSQFKHNYNIDKNPEGYKVIKIEEKND